MLCIIKLPENVNSKNEKLYIKSANILDQKLKLLKNEFEDVIAIGLENTRHLWPGNNWANQFDFIESGVKEKGNIIVVGLDAPFLSINIMKQFLLLCDASISNVTDECVCTFRKTPEQKNIAAMEHGGKMVCVVSQLNGALSLNIETSYDCNNGDDIDISVGLPQKKIQIIADCNLQFILSDIDRQNQQYLYSEDHDDVFFDKRINYSKNKNVYKISLFKDCMIQILEKINISGLYSKIHYGQAPVTVKDFIGVDENQTRINLKTLEKITGRQSFPDLYEPFLGIVMLKQSEILKFLRKGDGWFKEQSHLKPLIIEGKEAKLISEDNDFIITDWSRIQDDTNNK